MANQASKVLVGKPLTTGGVWVDPTAAGALPTNATTALAAAYVAAGYIGEDGVTETTDRSTDKIKAWGGDIVRVVQSDFSVTYQFTFIESLNTTVLESVYGPSNVQVTAAGPAAGTLRTVKVNGDELPRARYVFEIKDGAARIRVVIPDGQITEVGEITYADADLIGYQVTVEAFRHEASNANAIKYLDDGVFAP